MEKKVFEHRISFEIIVVYVYNLRFLYSVIDARRIGSNTKEFFEQCREILSAWLQQYLFVVILGLLKQSIEMFSELFSEFYFSRCQRARDFVR